MNNEIGFQLENVRSLCSVGQSTKKNKSQGYIGEKGIGFKSVFRVSDCPHIFSNGFRFRFEKPTDKEGFGYILPHWVEVLPAAVEEGFTSIMLPLLPQKRELIADQLSRIEPETVLFLKKLKRLHLGEERLISCDGEAPLVTLHCNGEEAFYFVHSELCEKPDYVIEEKRPNFTKREITIAFPITTASPFKGRVFAYLPTESGRWLPFLVNADFILSANRERVLEDRRWNQWLRDCIATAFVKAFLSLLKEPKWQRSAYRYLPMESQLASGADFFAPIIESI